ncbi:MAG: hypothetical protein AAF236_12310, partial [Verrucomicrobiota bacterium]
HIGCALSLSAGPHTIRSAGFPTRDERRKPRRKLTGMALALEAGQKTRSPYWLRPLFCSEGSHYQERGFSYPRRKPINQ